MEYGIFNTSYTPELTTENEVELVDSQVELSESEMIYYTKLIFYGQDNLNGVRSQCQF